jgi:tetratricopeptide (TPR) repeat protein
MEFVFSVSIRKVYFMKNLFPLLLLVLFFAGCTESNAQKLDSLKKELRDAQGAASCSTLFRIAFALENDGQGTIEYSTKAIECAKVYGDTLLMIKAARIKATGFRQIGEIDSSNALLFAVLRIARRKQDFGEMKYIIHGLALGLSLVGRYDEALRYNFEVLEIRKKYGGSSFVASTLNNIGLVYYKLRDYRKAIEYYSLALKEYKSESGRERLVESELVNIALCYAYIDELNKADSIIGVVRRSCKNNCAPFDAVNMTFCRGVVELSRHDTAVAKVQFMESYKLAKEAKYERLELDNIVYLSQISLALNEISEAAIYLAKAEELIQTGIPYNLELMKIYNEFARLYERKGDYRRATEFQRRYIAFRDSTQNEEMTIALMKIEAKHIEEAKNKEIETQNKMLELNKEVILRQKIASIFAFFSATLLAGCVVLLVRSVREKKNRNIDLEKRVKNRTIELESIAKQAQRALSEKNLWTGKILYSVRHTANTVSGLNTLATKDPDSRERCSQLIEHEMSHLLAEVGGYATKSDLGLNGIQAPN